MNRDETRLPPLSPDALDGDQRAVYQAITGGQRASGPQYFPLTDDRGRLFGPFDGMLRSPTVGMALQGLGAALRYGTHLTPRIREFAILAVAGRWDSAFERFAHEAVGRGIGLREDELTALRRGEVPVTADSRERAAVTVVFSLLERADLDEQQYRAAVAELDEQPLYELITLVGYYNLLALQLRVFRIGAPDSR